MIALLVNGAAAELDGETSVSTLVDQLGSDGRGVAVAVNETLIPRSAWSGTVLQAGDRVEVLRAAQGGC